MAAVMLDHNSRGTTPSSRWTHSPLSLRERSMLWFMNAVTEREDWRALVSDDRRMLIWASYLRPDGELASQTGIQTNAGFRVHAVRPRRAIPTPTPTPFDDLPPDLAVGGFTPDMFMACVREMRGMAGDPFVTVLDADASVVKGSLQISGLAQAVGVIEGTGTLLDPGDYPFVPGVTRCWLGVTKSNCLQTFGMGALVDGPLAPIPTEVSFASNGSARLESYVSNLHPRHGDIYTALEQLVGRAMPALITAMESIRSPRHRIPWSAAEAKCGTPDRCRGHCVPHRPGAVQERLFIDAHLPKPLHPAPTASLPSPLFNPEPRSWIRGRPRLQVLFRIERHVVSKLRPLGPKWERRLEEVVASAIYVTRAENIGAKMELRAPQGELPDIDLPVQRGSEVVRTVREMVRTNFYGHIEPPKWWERDRRTYLTLGSVALTEAKLVAWPSVLETKIEAESTGEEGALELVQVMLVDPQRTMMSTSEVPPQRADWVPLAEGVEETMCSLPAELRRIIWDMAEEDDAPYGSEANAGYRRSMEKERAPTTQSSRTGTPSRLPTPRQGIF